MIVQDDGEWVYVKIRPNRERSIETLELCAKMLVVRWNQELKRDE